MHLIIVCFRFPAFLTVFDPYSVPLSAVSVQPLGYGRTTEESKQISRLGKIYLFATAVRSAPGPTQGLFHCVQVARMSGIRHEAAQSTLFSAEDSNVRSETSTPHAV
jgi:hypothetical protein